MRLRPWAVVLILALAVLGSTAQPMSDEEITAAIAADIRAGR
jgi:hypothetical protein